MNAVMAPPGQATAWDPEIFRKNGHALIDAIAGFLATIGDRPVTNGEQPAEIRSFLGSHSLPAEGTTLENILHRAAPLLFDHSLHNGSPRFFGYVTSSALPAGMLADLLASAVNANAGAYILSPVATEIEKQTIRWLAEMIGYRSDCGGLFVSGGNMANITALLAARKAKAKGDIRQDGIGHERMLIYCTKGTHTWVHKAADLLGFGLGNIRWIDMNEQQEMNCDDLEQQLRDDLKKGWHPFLVIATAGTVSTGAVDPLDKIAAICRRYDCWFHVDGAYGAPAAAVPEAAGLFRGMEAADSIALDPHKWLYAPIEAGCVLMRDARHLQDAFSFMPPYYHFNGPGEEPVTNYLEYGFQNTRGFRALKVWVQLQQIGLNGYIKLIGENIRLAAALYRMAAAHEELEAVSHHLSVTCFRYIPRGYKKTAGKDARLDDLNEKILNRLQSGGLVFVSNAVPGDHFCLRACIVNFRTRREDIQYLTEAVVQCGREIIESESTGAITKENNSEKKLAGNSQPFLQPSND